MFRNHLSDIAAYFSAYAVRFSEDESILEIINPFDNENIKIEYVPEDEWTPYILYFSFQHWHLNDEENIIEIIRDIIDGKLLSIEFFKGDQRCFGGDVEAQDLQELSYEALENCFGDFPISIINMADSFKVRGWKADTNFDAVFDVGSHGEIVIKIL